MPSGPCARFRRYPGRREQRNPGSRVHGYDLPPAGRPSLRWPHPGRRRLRRPVRWRPPGRRRSAADGGHGEDDAADGGRERRSRSGRPAETAGAAQDSHDVSMLFRERHAELVRLAVLLVGDRPSAEDIVQDVFARLCLRDRLPGGDGSLRLRAGGRTEWLPQRAAAPGRRPPVRELRRSAGPGRHPGVRGARGDPGRGPQAGADRAGRPAVQAPRGPGTPLLARPDRGRNRRGAGHRRGTVKSTAARGLAALASKLGEQS